MSYCVTECKLLFSGGKNDNKDTTQQCPCGGGKQMPSNMFKNWQRKTMMKTINAFQIMNEFEYEGVLGGVFKKKTSVI